jgi:hypothetical protein
METTPRRKKRLNSTILAMDLLKNAGCLVGSERMPLLKTNGQIRDEHVENYILSERGWCSSKGVVEMLG